MQKKESEEKLSKYAKERPLPISFSLPPTLLDELDSIVYEKKIISRSSLIVQILREWITNYQTKKAKAQIYGKK